MAKKIALALKTHTDELAKIAALPQAPKQGVDNF